MHIAESAGSIGVSTVVTNRRRNKNKSMYRTQRCLVELQEENTKVEEKKKLSIKLGRKSYFVVS